jgi:hypothetical protein
MHFWQERASFKGFSVELLLQCNIYTDGRDSLGCATRDEDNGLRYLGDTICTSLCLMAA